MVRSVLNGPSVLFLSQPLLLILSRLVRFVLHVIVCVATVQEVDKGQLKLNWYGIFSQQDACVNISKFMREATQVTLLTVVLNL